MKTLLALILLSTSSAFAHISITPKIGIVDTSEFISFKVPHGCNGSPTTSIKITAPIAGLNMKPTVIPHWTITTVKTATPPELVKHQSTDGSVVTENTQITWTGSLEDGFLQPFVIALKLPKTPQILEFEVEQICESGAIIKYTSNPGTDSKIKYEKVPKLEVK